MHLFYSKKNLEYQDLMPTLHMSYNGFCGRPYGENVGNIKICVVPIAIK